MFVPVALALKQIPWKKQILKAITMKFAIFVLLGLFAVAAQASFHNDFDFEPQNSVTDKIRETVEAFLNKAVDEFVVVAEKVKAIINKVNNQAAELVMKARDKMNAVKQQIQDKLKEMYEKGGQIAACAKELEPEYQRVEDDAVAELKECAGGVYVASEEMREQVNKGMTVISKHVRDFRDMVGDCLGWNPISATKCVYEKIAEFKEVLGEIMSSCKAALSAVRHKAVEIIEEAKECNGRALSKARSRVDALDNKLVECSNSFYYY